VSQKVVEAAAKTGTGEIGLEESWHSWFVAYAPYQTSDPMERVVVVVMVEAAEGEYEWWAPKAGNAILQGIFAHQTYEEAARKLGLGYLMENR
jgi:penicillin-binding protein 2